jgi:tetratricopeptide (TPR) repeat protein
MTLRAAAMRQAWVVAWGLGCCAARTVVAQDAPPRSAADSSKAAVSLLDHAARVLRSVGPDSSTRVYRAARVLIPQGDSTLAVRAECAEQQVALQTRRRIADTVWVRLRSQARHSSRLSADCGFIHARYLESLGFQQRALVLLDTVARHFEAVQHWQNLSAVRQWQGTLNIAGGYYYWARKHLDTALVLARVSGSVAGEGWALQELGRMTQRLGAPEDAARYFAEATARFTQAGDQLGVLYARRAIAEGLLLRGYLAEADSALELVARDAQVLAPVIEVFTLVARADLHRQRARGDVTDSLLDRAQQLVAQRNVPGWAAEVQYQRAVRDMERGRSDVAQARFDSLLARRVFGPARFEVLMRKAETHSQGGRFDSATAAFAQARITLDRWRREFPDRAQALAVLQDRAFDWDRDLGTATMIDAFVRGGRVYEALAMAEWRRVRGQEQQMLQRSGLGVDAVQGTTVAAAGMSVSSNGVRGTRTPAAVIDSAIDFARLPTLSRVALSPQQAVVTFVMGQGGEPDTAFVLTRDTVRAVALLPIDSLRDDLTTLQGFLEAGREPASTLQRVSDAVWAPVRSAMPSAVVDVRLVPDGALHRVSFGALRLPDGSRAQDRFILSYAASVEDALGAVPRVVRRSERAGPLLIGAPQRMPRPAEAESAMREWAPLPGAREELRAIAARLDGARLFIGKDATAERLSAERQHGGPLLHLATHVTARSGSYLQTAVALQPTAAHDGLLRLPAFASAPLPFDLVVLSACASGDGVMQVGQGPHGLVSAALDAGARGVVATRWDVSDTAMTRFMLALYDTLAVQPNVAEAVTAVRRAFAARGESPSIWAAVEYYGDPNLRLDLPRRRPSAWSRFTTTLRRWFSGSR